MSGARQKNKRAERRARIVAFRGEGLVARQEEENFDEKARWKRRESRLHYDVREAGEERRMLAR